MSNLVHHLILAASKSGPDPIVGPLIGGGGAAVYAGSRAAGRRARLIRELPTSTCAGVFMGLNECEGTVEVGQGQPAPAVSPLAREQCVWWQYAIEEERQHQRTVTSTDSQGHTQTRVETYTEWHTIDSGDHTHETFNIRDASGTIQVRPDGANIDPVTVISEIVDHRSGWGWLKFNNFNPGGGATGRIRQTESIVPMGHKVVVVGHARQREDVVAPEFANSSDGKDYFISCRSMQQIEKSSSRFHWFLVVLSAIAVLAGIIVMGLSLGWPTWLGPVIGVVVVGIVGLISWTISIHNMLVRVRTRAVAAHGLLDVQLQRRHDLIPQLVSVADAAAAHEGSIHEHVTAMRAAIGQNDDAATANAGRSLIAAVEAYPNLRANEAFEQVMAHLVDAENRVAAARAYVVDAKTIVADAATKFPGVLIAKRMISADEFSLPPATERFVTPELDLSRSVPTPTENG